jgi:hypothetical protein
MECQFTVCPFEEVKVYDVNDFVTQITIQQEEIVSILEYIKQDHTTEPKLFSALDGVIRLLDQLKALACQEDEKYGCYMKEVDKIGIAVGYSKTKAQNQAQA